MKYLFIDVETPNRHNDSICSVAWILRDEQQEIRREYQLINPEAPFDPMNISIHGIRPEDVAGSPSFIEYWNNTLGALCDESVLIAHNASFDLSVIAKALYAKDLEIPRIKYIDTMPLFRILHPDESCKLKDIARRYGIEYQSHNAMSDVNTLAIALDLLKDENDFDSYESLLKSASMKESTAISIREKDKKRYYDVFIQEIIEHAKAAGIDLSDIHFAFHGDLESPEIYRKNGLNTIIEALGGFFHDNVSAKIDLFVCFDDRETLSVKKARQLAENPKNNIQIIYTDAFLDVIGYRTNHPDLETPMKIRERKQQALADQEREEAEKAEAAAKRKAEKEEKRAAAESKEQQEKKPVGRIVQQYDKDGNLIATYQTVTSAAEALNISTKVIRDAASGKQRTAGGYLWKYGDTE